MKADLHYHGLIGFQPKWLRIQGCEGKNLAGLIVNTAIDNDIDLVCLVSEEKGEPSLDYRIPKNSPGDRFGFLCNQAISLPKNYSYDKIGINILYVKKRWEKPIYIINSQAMVTEDNGNRYDHLVIGSNEIPNHRNLRDTINYCLDKGVIQIAEHPFCTGHFGIGEKLLEKYLSSYDAIEGFNAQMLLYPCLSFIPKIGIANRKVNEKAINFSKRHHKPYVSTSDGHIPSDLGISYIEFNEKLVDFSDEKKIINSLKEIILFGRFRTYKNYPSFPFINWIKWTGQFVYGHMSLPNKNLTT